MLAWVASLENHEISPRVDAGKPTPEKFLRFPTSLCPLDVSLLYEAEIVGVIDGRASFKTLKSAQTMSGDEK